MSVSYVSNKKDRQD